MWSDPSRASRARGTGDRIESLRTAMTRSNTAAWLGDGGSYHGVEPPHPGILLTLAGYFGLLFATAKLRNRRLFVFALTCFMGFTLGPILSSYLSLANGSQTVMNAMAATGAVFLGLSIYALVSRRDLSFMGGFLAVGILTAFLAGLGAIFFEIPALSLAVSAMFELLMRG